MVDMDIMLQKLNYYLIDKDSVNQWDASAAEVLAAEADEVEAEAAEESIISMQFDADNGPALSLQQEVKVAEFAEDLPALRNPWPYLGQFFQLLSGDSGGNLSYQCMLCGPAVKRLRCHKSSFNNLKSHIARKHLPEQESFLALLSRNSHRGRKSQSAVAAAAATASNPHGWAASTSASGEMPSQTVPAAQGSSLLKKRRIDSSKSWQQSVFGESQEESCSQEQVDQAIVDLFVSNMLPLRLVEDKSFLQLSQLLNRRVALLSSEALCRKIVENCEQMEAELISTLSQVTHVATTADCWTQHSRTYLSMTVHWIDARSRQRRFALLTFERLKGGCCFTAESLAQVITAVHEKFLIADKVVRIVTDSASNFAKDLGDCSRAVFDPAFLLPLSGHDSETAALVGHCCQELAAGTSSTSTSTAGRRRQFDNLDDYADDNEDSSDSAAFEGDEEQPEFEDLEVEATGFATSAPVALTELLASEPDVDCLPPRMRCASHTLHLVATADLQKLLLDSGGDQAIDSFRSQYIRTVVKAQAFWSLLRRSSAAAKSIKALLNGQKMCLPNNRSWTSVYSSLCQLSRLLKPQFGAKTVSIIEALNYITLQASKLGLPTFQSEDVEFLDEFERVMKPIALAIDILEDEREAYFGILLPTISATIVALKSIQLERMRYCAALANAMEAGVATRFQAVFDDRDCLLGAAFNPRFRLAWLRKLSDDGKAENLRHLMMQSLASLIEDDNKCSSAGASGQNNADPNASEDKSRLAFFLGLMQQQSRGSSGSAGQFKTSADKAMELVSEWVDAPDAQRDGLADSVFLYEKHLSNAFVRYNTPAPTFSSGLQRLLRISRDAIRMQTGSLSDQLIRCMTAVRCNGQLVRSQASR